MDGREVTSINIHGKTKKIDFFFCQNLDSSNEHILTYLLGCFDATPLPRLIQPARPANLGNTTIAHLLGICYGYESKGIKK